MPGYGRGWRREGAGGRGSVTVAVAEVAGRRPWRSFFTLPRRVYGGDPHHLPTSRKAQRAALDRRELHGRQRVLLATDGGEPVARVVARLSPRLRDDGGRPLGLLGSFEALDHPPAVAALLGEASGWLRASGAGQVVGPMDGDTWHRYRLNLGPYDERPFLMEPYNPPYYPGLWEASGFAPLQGYHSRRIDDLAAVEKALAPRLDGTLAEGFRLEPIRLGRFDSELARLHRLASVIFAGNYLYTDISAERFVALYRASRPLVDPDLVVFAVAPDGTDAGFLFALPDRFAAVAAYARSRVPWATLRFLVHRRRPAEVVNFKSLGVLPAHRRSHLASALIAYGYRAARGKGYRRVNHCLMQNDNPSGRLDAGQGRLLRRYRLYRREAA